MKIAIIGKGTSSIITALTLIEDNHEIHIFYDPEIPHLSVGESTTPHFGHLIEKTLDFSIGRMSDRNIVSFKNGIKFINWGTSEFFRHHFNGNESAFHFETGKLNPFLHDLMEKKLDVTYHAIRVNGYDIKDDKIYINDEPYDFMVNCSGWDDNDEYYEPFFETVNSAFLYTENTINDPSYTLHRATPHGWQFGLPFPDRGVTKCGYLYNSNYTKEEEIEELFKNKEYKKISWTPKYCKKMIKNRFVANNGNRLFFYEPLQALSILYYVSCAEFIKNFLYDRSLGNFYKQNGTYLDTMKEYHVSLALHYQYGSKYKTTFWEKTSEASKNYLNYTPLHNIDEIYEGFYADYMTRKLDGKPIGRLKLGCFTYSDWRDIHSGMTGIDVESIKQNNPDLYHYPPFESEDDDED